MMNNYLLIDFGNTNVKAGIYKNNELTNINFICNNSHVKTLLKKFNLKDLKQISKIFVCSTTTSNKFKTFINDLTKTINVKVKIINKKDFKNLLDFSNVNKKVVIGNDLLLLGLYVSHILKHGAIFCLGTVYTAVIVDKKQFQTVLFIPSIAKAISNISSITSIPSNLIPTKYNKQKGLNTPDCISTGANLLLEGWVDNALFKYDLDKTNVLITGGDSNLYLNINKKYKVIDNLTLKALALLVNLKKW